MIWLLVLDTAARPIEISGIFCFLFGARDNEMQEGSKECLGLWGYNSHDCQNTNNTQKERISTRSRHIFGNIKFFNVGPTRFPLYAPIVLLFDYHPHFTWLHLHILLSIHFSR